MTVSIQRCAIYTRKSTEERLDQEFNTLDAQREACSAYITSQRHEGWQEAAALYDDGGFSGGSMERPALKQLLEDVRSGRINVVVVYKVDRLTRSLSDFARIVDTMDRAGASFVSVTQSFNTTTSMGRLTLNVLLSFAQFEREVTTERIRDKIAASKRKGMWMGGPVPLGYSAQDRTLVPHESEAGIVRDIFRRYLSLGTVHALQRALRHEGVVSRVRISRKDDHPRKGGKPYSSGALYQILRNPIYHGLIPHREKRYPGRHKAIIDEPLWKAVQARLDAQGGGPRSTTRTATGRPLEGLLFDQAGNALRPTYATRKVGSGSNPKTAKRYWYYATRRKADADAEVPVTRVRADDIENLIRSALCKRLGNPEWVIDTLSDDRTHPDDRIKRVKLARSIAEKLVQANGESTASPEWHQVIAALLHRVTLGDDAVTIDLAARQITGTVATDVAPTISIDVPVDIHRSGHNKPVILHATEEPFRDADLIALIADARRWAKTLVKGETPSVEALTQNESIARGTISRTLPLAWLAPDIATAILEGRQPRSLTASKLRKLDALPLDWNRQRQTLGFPQA